MKGKLLTAQDILGVHDSEFVEIDVPEWGGTVRLRSLSADSMIALRDGVKDSKSALALILLSLSACDEDGNPLFTREDLEQLKKKSMKPILRLQQAAMKLNELEENEKEVEAAKND